MTPTTNDVEPTTSATERLRELLDERGVEWRETALGETRWLSTVLNGNASAKRINDKLVLFTGYKLITPEQAIAATLGVGTLTAKQVVAIAGRHQPDYCSDTHVCFDWQAIADELNSTLGSSDCTNNCTNNCTNSERTETCHADETDTWECVCDQIGRYGKRVTIHVMECSECGRTYEHVNGDYEFCPHCGRKVVDPTTNDVDAEVDG